MPGLLIPAAGKRVPGSKCGMRPFSLGDRAGAWGLELEQFTRERRCSFLAGGNECCNSLSGEQLDLALPEPLE